MIEITDCGGPASGAELLAGWVWFGVVCMIAVLATGALFSRLANISGSGRRERRHRERHPRFEKAARKDEEKLPIAVPRKKGGDGFGVFLGIVGVILGIAELLT